MRRVRSRLTYANVMATLAVFVALGGSAAAAVIITSNDEVAPDTISGHNPPAGAHSNLIAGSVNQDDLAPDAQTCRTPGLLTIRTGGPQQVVCISGALHLKARCFRVPRSGGGFDPHAQLMIRTNVDHAFASGIASITALIRIEDLNRGPYTPLVDVRGFTVGSPFVVTASFTAGAPDGSQLAGQIGIRVTKTNDEGRGTCEFVLGASR
jgi:hypothetical protein